MSDNFVLVMYRVGQCMGTPPNFLLEKIISAIMPRVLLANAIIHRLICATIRMTCMVKSVHDSVMKTP